MFLHKITLKSINHAYNTGIINNYSVVTYLMCGIVIHSSHIAHVYRPYDDRDSTLYVACNALGDFST